MKPRSLAKWVFLTSPLALIVLGLVLPIQTIIWDGGFPDAEYRLTFVDADGRPIEGVALQVQTQHGGTCYFYPVNEFLPNNVPISDVDGRMVLHHRGDHLEFSGRDQQALLGFYYSREHSPQYDCIFFLGEREVHRFRYSRLLVEASKSGQQSQFKWKAPDWVRQERRSHMEDWRIHSEQLFDCNHDGVLDREEKVALWYFESVPSRENPELPFEVVELRITISTR
jgi:hypothetical protein